MSVLTLRRPTAREPGRARRPRWSRWSAPISFRRRWVVAVFAACAVFAGGTAVFSSTALHRMWGVLAAGAYGVAALAVLAWKERGVDLALVVSLGGALVAPLTWMAAMGQGQPEVGVIVRSADLLVRHGTPYQSPAQLAATHDPNAYNPYLPVMTLFGLPRALAGHPGVLADPRLWFGTAFVALFALALIIAGAPNPVRWTALVLATPVIAFPLAVGGTDLPVLGLMCLGLALLRGGPRPLLAGLVLGLAAATKATAWPALVVAAALLASRDGLRVATKFAGISLAAFAVAVVPTAVLWPNALLQNTILFPLGLTDIKTKAASPLPGHLLAATGTTGHLIAVALLVAAGVAIAGSLVVRPPADVPAATRRLALGLGLMFVLAPATRWGYFLYPIGLCTWVWLTGSSVSSLTVPGKAEMVDTAELRQPAATMT